MNHLTPLRMAPRLGLGFGLLLIGRSVEKLDPGIAPVFKVGRAMHKILSWKSSAPRRASPSLQGLA